METNLQVMENWSTIYPKQDGLGLISLICNVTHRRDETDQEILNIVRADKELILCHQKDHIALTQYLADFKEITEIVSGAGGNPGHHPASVTLL